MGSRFQGSIMARVLAFSALLIHSSLGCTVVSQRSRRSTALPDHGERSLLHRDLMEGYEKDVIPMEAAPNADNDANAVVFNLGASVIRMDMKNLENDELKPVLEMTSWLRMSWMDFRLKWLCSLHPRRRHPAALLEELQGLLLPHEDGLLDLRCLPPWLDPLRQQDPPGPRERAARVPVLDHQPGR